jgi:hypothetical protein
MVRGSARYSARAEGDDCGLFERGKRTNVPIYGRADVRPIGSTGLPATQALDALQVHFDVRVHR